MPTLPPLIFNSPVLTTSPIEPPTAVTVPALTIFKALPLSTYTAPSAATSMSFKTLPPFTEICLIPSAFT